MAWKSEWKLMTGDLKVTARGIDEEDTYRTFDFICYADSEVDDYDRLESIERIAHLMGGLRDYYHTEIIDIQRIKEK